MPRYDTILFDLDGTLTDPLEGITKGAQFALHRMGIEVADNTTLSYFIGPPLLQSFMEHFGFTRDQAVQAARYYREYFQDQGIFQNLPYPGVAELLAGLQRSGCRLMTASSKPELFVRRILDRFGLSPYLCFAGGSELAENSTQTKADVIRYVLRETNTTDLTRTVMVGDRKYDVEGAHACGLPCIGVLYGYGSREELTQAGADALAEDFPQLLSLLTL